MKVLAPVMQKRFHSSRPPEKAKILNNLYIWNRWYNFAVNADQLPLEYRPELISRRGELLPGYVFSW